MGFPPKEAGVLTLNLASWEEAVLLLACLSQKLKAVLDQPGFYARIGTRAPPEAHPVCSLLHSQEWVAESKQPSRFARQGLLGGDT